MPSGICVPREQEPGQAWGQGWGASLFPCGAQGGAQIPLPPLPLPAPHSMCCTHRRRHLAAPGDQGGRASLRAGPGQRGQGKSAPCSPPTLLHVPWASPPSLLPARAAPRVQLTAVPLPLARPDCSTFSAPTRAGWTGPLLYRSGRDLPGAPAVCAAAPWAPSGIRTRNSVGSGRAGGDLRLPGSLGAEGGAAADLACLTGQTSRAPLFLSRPGPLAVVPERL